MSKTAIATTALALAFAMGPGWIPAIAQEAMVTGEARAQEDIWLPDLTTETPQEGFALAVKLSRMGVKTTQPDTAVLHALREHYARDADSLIAASQVIASPN